jgi:mono/diheme cytochrome c family protein
MAWKKNFLSQVLFTLAAVLLARPAAADDAAPPENKGFAAVKVLLSGRCSACHDWTGSFEGISDPARVIPYSPEKSLIYKNVESDYMPADGEKLTPAEKSLIRAWIAAGATSSEEPLKEAAGPQASVIAIPPAQTPTAESLGLQGFPDKVTLHAISGFSSAGLLLAAGAVSTVHFLSMMQQGHAYRDSIGYSEDGGDEALRTAEIRRLWNDPTQQALRWWHVGLLASGSALYLFDAGTGITMWSGDQPGITRAEIHRYAFFTHAALMATEIVLGLLTSFALEQGSHDMLEDLGLAHAVIGFTIPLVMIAGGLENILQ